MVTNEICGRSSVSQTFELLRNNDKTLDQYELLAFRDSQLEFKSLEYGSVKYLGQTRSLGKPYGSQQNIQGGPEGVDLVKCGYGKLQWPDGSIFEGFWLNGQSISIGVFKTPENDVYEGMWLQDKATGLCVFRQSDSTEK